MREKPRNGLTIRAALFLALALTTGLWLLSGYSLTRRIVQTRQQADGVNTRYMQAQELLSTIRMQTLLGSVFVRDALLDPNPRVTDEYRRQFDETCRAAREALDKYAPILNSSEENPRVDRLRDEVEAFQQTMRDVLASDSARWPTEARLLIRSRIMPTRETVVNVSEEVQALNRAVFVQQQRATAEVYTATQQSMWWQFGLALVASTIIGLFSARHVASLEADLRTKNAREVRHTRDLQRLSTQLVTAQEDERRTIARELHDEVGQLLTALKVELALTAKQSEPTSRSSDAMSRAIDITDQAVHAVRDLSHLLHPAVLDDLGLAAALETLVRDTGARHTLAIEFLHDPMPQRLTREVEAATYRIVQEALTNVVRHAHATRCRVYLQQLPHSVIITVEDDGVGFDVGETEGARAGLGLLGIRERAAQLRGATRFESVPGKGTRLTVELPAHYRMSPVETTLEPATAPEPTHV